MRRYINLLVVVSPVGDGRFEARVSSDQGVGRSQFKPPFRLADVISHAVGPAKWRSLGTVKPIAPEYGTARECGVALFEALFTGEAREVLVATETQARALPETGVRIRLAFDLTNAATAEVAALPWELMRRPNDDPLVVTMQTALVRSLDVPKPITPRPFIKPLRILLIRSNPDGTGALNLAKEGTVLINALKRLPGIKVDEVVPVPAAIRDQLARDDYHVVHYMGHGDFQADRGGMLLLENEDDTPHLVSAATFASWLKNEPLRLVFLNACETGTTPDGAGLHPFAGVAAALIQSNAPAVVAMQFPISDSAAIEFARTFYTRIADGYPVDAAVAEGRNALFEDDATEWATPVLYLRPEDGNLFDEGAAEPARKPPEAAPQLLVSEPTPAASFKRTLNGMVMGVIALLVALVAYVALQIGDPDQDAQKVIDQMPASLWIDDNGGEGAYAKDVFLRNIKKENDLLDDEDIYNGLVKLASEANNFKAQYILAEIIMAESLERGSTSVAKSHYLSAAKGGLITAQYWVGIYYKDGLRGFEQDPAEARHYLEMAAPKNKRAREAIDELDAPAEPQ